MSTILVVDDEPAIVEILEEHLRSEGYDTCHAYSGEEALARLAKVVPDLVILDLMLPGMDGYEVCRLMQADVRLNHIPIIMLTAQGAVPNKVMGYERGADDYMVKPFEAEELRVRVRAQLHHLYHDTVSELTGLSGVEAVEKRIAEVLANDPSKWEIIYVDIANFSAYNESYSYVEGDEMIEVAAHSLKTALQADDSDLGAEHNFVGHTGGDKFVMIVQASRARDIAEEAQRLFAESTVDFYSPTDSKHGYLVTINRQGVLTKSGLCTLRFDVVRAEE
ncbi:MAG TPA: response regulator [Chloroflexia bacterium]|nr:response regulator [Chloroflexia bacterium]